MSIQEREKPHVRIYPAFEGAWKVVLVFGNCYNYSTPIFTKDLAAYIESDLQFLIDELKVIASEAQS